MNRQIAVIGGREEPESVLAVAQKLGMEIGKRGLILVCGGMGGVMEAACRGAKAAGGTTVGILPVSGLDQGNPYLDIVIPTGLGDARNAVLINSVRAVIAVGGRYGTLSEIAFALARGLPVASISSWEIDPAVYPARDALDAVEYVMKRM
ncbi:TIGR00725 family protein [bacterium]|nr:TIGR00725 family protein [bacterium]